MMEVPFLTLPEVRQEIDRISRRTHRSKLVALYGRGESSEFELGGQRWRIVPTRCELDLREHMPRPEEQREEGNVFLIDWTPDLLPLDLACRLAGGRLYHVAREARLAALFGARQVGPGLAGTALIRLFLSGAVLPPRKIQGLTLTPQAAWTSLLEARFGLSESVIASPGALLAWAISDNQGPAFLRQAETDDLWRNVRRELCEWIRTNAGQATLVVWQAWELGLSVRLVEALLLMESAREAGNAFLSGQLVGMLAAWLPSLAEAIRETEAELIDTATLNTALPADREALLGILEASQALADAAGLGELSKASLRLPGGHVAREQALGAAVRAFLAETCSDKAAKVLEALQGLEAHTLDAHLRPEDHQSARKNLGRLSLWLAQRETPMHPGTRWQPAVDLAQRYSEEGGYVEWARQQLRGLRGAEDSLLKAARELEHRATQALRDDHRTFAEAYVSWIEAGKPSPGAVPIEDLGKQVIAPFIKGGSRRRLLVVLMDGMSWATAIQVLTRLTSARRWKPIAWRRESWHGVLPLPPVLAAVPTLTELSRGAFFAGKTDPKFYDEGTDKDPARWQNHRALAETFGEKAAPLFLRRDLLSGHDLVDEVRGAIKGECPAVAVVVNAIDEDLRGSVQVAKDYSLTPVLPLEALLDAAEEGERVVLLVADHGHVLGDGTRPLEGRMGPKRVGGARWRALAPNEAPSAEEVVLPPGTWVPRGWNRVATLWDPAVVNRSANYGEHGGLSLAEAVAPAILIAPDWLERAIPDDPHLAVRALPVPDWWELRIQRPVIRPVDTPPERPVQLARPTQPALFDLGATEPPKPQMASVPPFIAALRRSVAFQNQIAGLTAAEVERVLSWLTVLIHAGGTMPSGDFATAAGVRAHQVAGVVARMGVLNADGFAMVEHDHVGRRVVLHRSRLVQHYGIKE